MRRSSPTCARGTSPPAGTARRSRACSTCSCSAAIPTACAARSTSAGSRTSPSSALAASRSPTTSARRTPWSTPSSPPRPADGRPTTRGGARAARGAVDAELLAVFLDEPYYALDAAEVDRQGAVPPRLRARARRRPRDRDRRPARDADRALGRDGRRRPAAARGRGRCRGGRWHAQPDADGRARPPAPGRADRDLRRVRHPRGGARRRSCSRSSAS